MRDLIEIEAGAEAPAYIPIFLEYEQSRLRHMADGFDVVAVEV